MDNLTPKPPDLYYTTGRLQSELCFHMAQRIARAMLANHLISKKEFRIL